MGGPTVGIPTRLTPSWLQVCSAAFCPDDANLLAVGTAASVTRLYDVRRLDAPLGSAAAPRAVSYVRFMGKQLVAASVDSVLCMYDTAAVAGANSVGAGAVAPVREFRGHLNNRNFVGLATSPEGYMFTGSEANSVVMYHRSLPTPIAEAHVMTADEMGVGSASSPDAIVSCVAVSQGLDFVVTGGTTGWVNVMKLCS
jgi:WD40 repeat protein